MEIVISKENEAVLVAVKGRMDAVTSPDFQRDMEDLVAKTGGTVVARVAIFTEGDERENVATLGHLPLFFDEE